MIAILCYSISPHNIARFKALGDVRNDFVIIEIASNIKKYPWQTVEKIKGIQILTLFPGSSLDDLNHYQVAKKAIEALNKIKPDVVVTASYSRVVMRWVAAWAKLNGVISINENDTWGKNKRRFFLFEILKGIWCRLMYDGIFAAGYRTAEYYHGLGFPIDKIWRGRNAIENCDFDTMQSTVNQPKIIELEDKLPPKYFLTIARFSKDKDHITLFKAFKKYIQTAGSWHLVCIGAGPEENHLRNFVRKENIPNIHFFPWQSYEIIPYFYQKASCMILPSISEAWGFVANEALASGLPVLLSNNCGCVPELCLPGLNGYVIPAGNSKALADKMILMSAKTEAELQEMGQMSKKIIKRFSPENQATAFFDCTDTLLMYSKRSTKKIQ